MGALCKGSPGNALGLEMLGSPSAGGRQVGALQRMQGFHTCPQPDPGPPCHPSRAPPAPGEQPRAWCLQARPGAGGQTRSPPATNAAGGEPPPCCGGISFLCKYSNGISLKVCFEQHFCVYMRGNTCNPPASFSGIALAHLGNRNAPGCEVTGEG